MDNAAIAARLDAFAALLELAGANPYTARAYRRAGELMRGTPVPVAELVRQGRARELRGIGPGIERRLASWSRPGAIAELEELERDLDPELVALGRFLGLGAQRLLEIGRALGVRSPPEFRAAAAAGRLREVQGIGPKTERRIREALEREPPRAAPRPLLLPRARGSRADRRGARRRSPPAIRGAGATPRPARRRRRARRPGAGRRALRRAAGDRRRVERASGRARRHGRGRPGRARRRAAGRARHGARARDRLPAWVEALGPLPDAPTRTASSRSLGPPFSRRSCARLPTSADPPPLVELDADPRRPPLPHDVVGREGERARDGPRRAGARLRVPRDLRPHAAVGAVPGLDGDALRRQGEEIAAANEQLAPFRILRGVECDILRDGGARPARTTCSPSSTGCSSPSTRASARRARS